MHGYGYDDSGNEMPNEDEVIEQALGENPRAVELHQMRSALEQRRAAYARERDTAKDDKERAGLNARLAELDKQIAALRREEAISSFVENSVRFAMHKPALDDDSEY